MKNNKVIYVIISVIAILLVLLGVMFFTKKNNKPNPQPENNTNEQTNNNTEKPIDNNTEQPVDNTGDNNNSGEPTENNKDTGTTPSLFSDGYILPKESITSMDFGKSCVANHNLSAKQKICFDSLKDVKTEMIDDYKVNQENDSIELFAINYSARPSRSSLFEDDAEEYKNSGLNKSSNKISREDKNGYIIETYHYVYYNDYKATSVMYIFVSNDNNNIFIKYRMKDKTISEALAKKIIEDITFEKTNELPTKADQQNNILEVVLERPGFYKRSGGKLVDREFTDQDLVYKLYYSISGKDFKEVALGDGLKNKITFSKRTGEYTMNILLDNGMYLSLNDIEQSNNKSYSIISTNANYSIAGKTVLKQEYTYNGKKYLEYYYLNDSGFYVRYQFEANSNYTYNTSEIENLLNFDIS